MEDGWYRFSVSMLAKEEIFSLSLQKLSSTTSVLVTTYKDVEVLFSLQSKLATYLDISPDDIFNEYVKIERLGVSSLTFDYQFSTRYLIGSHCNVSAIIGLREKLVGVQAEEGLKQALLPQFGVISMEGEAYQQYCQSFSSSPPEVNSIFGKRSIQMGQFFSFPIAETLFLSPNGTEMPLELQLHFQNGTMVPSNYWLGLSGKYIHEKVSLRGAAISQVITFKQQLIFRIVAITPVLSEAFQSIQLDLDSHYFPVLVTISFFQASSVTLPYPEFAEKFTLFLSSFLRLSQHQIILLGSFSSSESSVRWTLTTMSSVPCNFTQLSSVQDKIIDSEGNPTPTLKSGIYSTLGFSLSSVALEFSGSCGPPRVNVTIPILYVPRYDTLSYVVPEHAFIGGRGHLQLKMLESAGNKLATDSWIWFDNKTLMMAGFPTSISTPKTFHYLLRAIDTTGAFADQNITVKLNWTPPAYNLAYQISFSYDGSILPKAKVIATFLYRLKSYFNQSLVQNIIAFNIAFLANNKAILRFQNTTISTDSCDIKGHSDILAELKLSPTLSTPNAAFVLAMQPGLVISKVEEFVEGSCGVLNRKPPYFNFFDGDAVNFAATIKTIPYCTVEHYLVPATLFIDEEDGSTRNLRLNLTADNKQALSLSNWVNLNTTSQTIIGVATDGALPSLSGPFIQYRLYAFDSDGKYDYAPLKFNVSGPAPTGPYNVTMRLKVLKELMNQPYALHLANLYVPMSNVFDNDMKIHTRSYKLEEKSGEMIANFIWSPCSFSEFSCNLSTIAFIRSKIFQSGTNEINAQLKTYFEGTFFSILSASESLGDKCREEPPTVRLKLPVLDIRFCGLLAYKIPENTFYDKQDGGTSKLKLKLLQTNEQAIPSGYWLQFDAVLQTIKGALTQAQNSSGFGKEQAFILVATDSSNLSSNTTVLIRVNGSMAPYSHTFTIQTSLSKLPSDGIPYEFSRKLQIYFGDSINTIQIISGETVLEKTAILSWTNCSLRYNPCDVIGIEKIRSEMKLINGVLKSEFFQAMKPEFTQLILSENNTGPCLTDEPPRSSSLFGPVSVSSCQTFSARIPEEAFIDNEQGNARKLDLSLDSHGYEWITFNPKSQEIQILATNRVIKSLSAKSVKVTLVAKDLKLQQTSQEIAINFFNQSQAATHKVVMQYLIANPSEFGGFVETYSAMRQNITRYFSNSLDVLSSVEFESLPLSLVASSVLSAEWSSCSMLRFPCNRSAIDRLSSKILTNSDVDAAFKDALRPHFLVTSIDVKLDRVCNESNVAPIVLSPLSLINVSYCGYTEYKVPSNTFYDQIDGFTQNLTLAFLNTTGQPVLEPWIEFDASIQTFRIVLADNLLVNSHTPRLITFSLKATSKRGLSVTDKVRILVSEQPRNESIKIKINFAWVEPRPPLRNKILITVAERFARYLGGLSTDIHFVQVLQEPLSSYPYFVLRIANCSIPYSPCHKEYLRETIPKLHNKQGTVPEFKLALGSEIYVTYLQVIEHGPCLENNLPPYVNKPLGKIHVHRCSDFNYTLPPDTFRDETDSILGLRVTYVNGIPISGNYRWLRMVSIDHLLVGVVTAKVLKEQPLLGYNVTIRATDSRGLFAETHLIIQVIGEEPQELYKFSLQLKAEILGEQFLEEREVILLLNSYFQSRFTNLLSYTHSSSLSAVITIKCSICVLEHRCNEAAASSYFTKISTADNKATVELQNYFSYKYTIISAVVYRNSLCLQPQNPPVPISPTWTITGSYCGGIHAVVPSNMFSDPEEGNTRNLSLNLYLGDRKNVPGTNWLQINTTSQVIYGKLTRSQTLNHSDIKDIVLVAKDKTGLEGNTSIKFKFTSHQEPRYTYKIAYQTTRVYSSIVSELQDFSQKLQAYLKDSSSKSVGLIQYFSPLFGSHTFQYANCSVSYNPCDTASLNEVKNLLLTSTNLPTDSFKQAMRGFHINYGEIQRFSPCRGGNLNPPSVQNRIHMLNVSICGLLSYTIPENTFYDTEDGNTRRLILGLRDSLNKPLQATSWLQLNKTSQLLYGYGTASLMNEQYLKLNSFALTATDSTSLSASNSFLVKINGPSQIIIDCQIQLLFNTAKSASLSDFHVIQKIFQGLQSYFSLRDSEIGIADFTRHSNTQCTLAWSYCSPGYDIYSSSITHLSYHEYKQFAVKVLMALFENDRKTVKNAFYSAFTGMTVLSVKTAFSGVCANIPPILFNLTDLRLNVNSCGYQHEIIQEWWIYDYEDGRTYNLNVQLVDYSNQSVGIESWINIDRVKWRLQMSLHDKQRYSPVSRFSFYLTARDSGGKSVVIPVYVKKLPAATKKSPFYITFEYKIKKKFSRDVYVNESGVLSDVTSRLFSLGSSKNVGTFSYTAQVAPQETRSFTWVPCQFEACSLSTTLQTTKQLLLPDRTLFDSFRKAYLPEFELQRAYLISSCGVPGLPPATPDGSLHKNITMCQPFLFQLPLSTFVDSLDGEMRNLKVRLLDGNKRPVSSSSWLQLNTATLELYGIFQSSFFSSQSGRSMTSFSSSLSSSSTESRVFDFYLEATNSLGLKAFNIFKANVLNYPYTSDCYTTVTLKRKFGGENVLQLDVLYKLVTAISQFYNEKAIHVKVYNFTQLSASSYSLTFSNCSFVFSVRKAAMWGLDESHRSSITRIFSKMVESNGTARDSFVKFLKLSGFILESISNSYSCIEEEPTSKIKSLRPYAFLCREFDDPLANDLFSDKRDGSNLIINLCYENGAPVSPNEWVQIDTTRRTVYGSVTYMVKERIPSFVGYSYLLVATDSSGRTANVSYQIKIANAPPLQDVRFAFGFDSVFTPYSRTADIFLNVTRKLAKYLNNNAQGRDVIIYSYDAINFISFELCSFECTPARMTSTLPKLQKDMFMSSPSETFKAAMAPEIIPRYILANGPKCVESTTVTIVVNYLMVTDQPICGFINYVIPDNVLRSSLGETTRDLLLNLKTSAGHEVEYSSLIHFHQDIQAIHGVVVFSKLSSSLTYVLTASSTRSTSQATTANVRINFPDYNKYKKVETSVCSLLATVKTTFNPALTDVYILRQFMQKIASYLKSDTQQVQVLSYTRSSTYPIKLTIRFTNCSWLHLLQSATSTGSYYQHIESVLQSIFNYSGKTVTDVSSNFTKSLQPEFALINISRNVTSCTPPIDRPPTTRRLTPIIISACGEFTYRIPANLFSDEDGNTRNLQIEVLQSDGKELAFDSWIVFNKTTQAISGMPLNATLAQQPQNGYNYRIKATDKLGKSTFSELIIKIDGKPYQNYPDIGFSFFYVDNVFSRYSMNHILAFTRKVSTYIGDPLNRFRIVEYTLTQQRISITLMNCTRCNAFAAMKYFAVLHAKTHFNLHMAPEFPVSFYLKAEGKCRPSDDAYRNVTAGNTYDVFFCRKSELDFVKLNGLSRMPPDVKFIVNSDAKQPLPVNSWFWFNETSSILEVFPSESIWKSQLINGTDFSTTTALISTGERLGSYRQDSLRIAGLPPSSGLQYTAKFTATTTSKSIIDAYLISLVFNPLYAYLGREDLQFVSITRDQANGLKFELSFLICGLSTDCTNGSVKTLHNKVFENPSKLRAQFTAIFSGQIKITSMTDNCKDNPPMIPNPVLNITVPVCGLSRYKLPKSFANDYEDGDADNLSISLRMPDSSLLGRDSWIRFNETAREIYAFPTEGFVQTQPANGWEFLIIVKDKGGKQTSATLNVFLIGDSTTYYRLSMSFQTNNIRPTTPFLDIQIRFLTMLSAFYFDESLSRYKVLSFTKTGNLAANAELFHIKFGNCSINQAICTKSDEQLRSSQKDLHTVYSDEKNEFHKFMSTYFIITSVKNESSYLVDKSPKALSATSVVRLESCGMYVNKVYPGIFYDEEQGTNLRMTLTYENGSKPDLNHWIQLINKQLYIVPNMDIQSGIYRMTLSAYDSCNQAASTAVMVNYTKNHQNSPYLFDIEASVSPTMPSIYYSSQVISAFKNLFSDSTFYSRISYFVRDNTKLRLLWENCNIECNHVEIKRMRNEIFIAEYVIRPSLLSSLNFNATNITELYAKNCSKPISEPPFANRSIALKVPICSKLNFSVPLDIFHDVEDGNTRNLHLSLLTESKQAINLQSWVQLDQSRQVLYGYPRVDSSRPIQRTFKYLLAATDKSGYSTTTPVNVEIIGNDPIISYKLYMKGITSFSQNSPLVLQEINLINGIGSYFNDYSINDMSYTRNGESFHFVWSFCSMKTDICDCFRIKRVRQLSLFVQNIQQYIGSEFTVTKQITDQMTGICSHTEKPELRHDLNELNIITGQYFSYTLREDKFFDYEDGYIRNLTLYISDSSTSALSNSYWIKVQGYKICGLLTLTEAERLNVIKASSKEYKTVARDSCGKETSDSYIVRMTSEVTILQYKITVFIKESFGKNCSQMNSFVEKISSFLQTPVGYIYVHNYTSNGLDKNLTVVVWGLKNITERNCNNRTVGMLREKFADDNGTVTQKFHEHMKPQFEVCFLEFPLSRSRSEKFWMKLRMK